MAKKCRNTNGFCTPAKGVGRVKSAAEVQILSSAPRKARENIVFSLAFSFILPCFAKKSSILAFQKMLENVRGKCPLIGAVKIYAQNCLQAPAE